MTLERTVGTLEREGLDSAVRTASGPGKMGRWRADALGRSLLALTVLLSAISVCRAQTPAAPADADPETTPDRSIEDLNLSVWHNSPSLTGTYTMHAARGNYLSLGLGYVRGAAITPRVDDTLTFTVNWGLYL